MGTRRTRRFWLCWALALAVTAVWTISASPVQTSQPVGGAAHGSYVALTFDDGPWPGTTNALLDGLAQRGVKATFFLVGEQVADRAETVRRMADEGHQIGLHTWHHVSLKGMTPDQITSQLDQTRAAICEIVGPVDLMLRPPYGCVDDTLRQCPHHLLVLRYRGLERPHPVPHHGGYSAPGEGRGHHSHARYF